MTDTAQELRGAPTAQHALQELEYRASGHPTGHGEGGIEEYTADELGEIVRKRLRARQREGEREPVAWRVRYRRIGRGWTWFRLHADKAKAVQDVEHLIQNYKSVSYAEAVPLYTEPPADTEGADDG